MTVAMVAKRLRHSAATVYALIESGRLAHYRCPGIRVSEAQLQLYLESVEEMARSPRQAAAPTRTKLKHITL